MGSTLPRARDGPQPHKHFAPVDAGSQHLLFDSNEAVVFPGRISHTRLLPKVHSFSYPFLIAAIPVRNCQSNWFLSVDSTNKAWWRRGWLRIDPEDHLQRGDNGVGLSRKLDCFLQSKGYNPANYPTVWLITSPRYLGHKSNQASFWYLYSSDRQFAGLIVEVNNTFDERRLYLLPVDGSRDAAKYPVESTPRRPGLHFTWLKDIHVSPFNSRDEWYSFSSHDLILPTQTHLTDTVHITVALLTPQHQPKMVSRVWSVSSPLHPSTTPVSRALLWLVSWSSVGPLVYPRTLFQAFVLYRRHNLKVHNRPEPSIDTIPRRSTRSERYVRGIFVRYLQYLLAHSMNAFHLCLEDPTCIDTPNCTGTLILSSSCAGPASPVYTLKIATPKFYATATAYPSIANFFSNALSPRVPDARTALTSPSCDAFVALMQHIESEACAFTTKSNTTDSVEQAWYSTHPAAMKITSLMLRFVWAYVMIVRQWLWADCDDGPRFSGSKACYLDKFVRTNYEPAGQIRYLSAVLMAAFRERILRTTGGG